MRLGKVVFNIEYVVDLDNANMVEEAKQAIWDDIGSWWPGYIWNNIKIENKVDEFVTENDIPSFLLEEELFPYSNFEGQGT